MTVPLIGLAHGSRHPGRLRGDRGPARRDRPAGRGIETRPAYLDLADAGPGPRPPTPWPPPGIRRAVVVPLLFTAAFHATIDVPEAVRGAAARSGVELVVADILGTGDDVVDLLRAALADAGVGPEARCCCSRSAPPPGRQRRPWPTWPTGWRARRAAPVRAAFGTCDPRPETVVAELDEPVAVVPLFLADGLLLDPVRTLAAERGWTMTEPLGRRAAGSCSPATDRRRIRARLYSIGFDHGHHRGARRPAAIRRPPPYAVSAAKIAEFARALGDDEPALPR